ncbi:MAG: hypothetical protein WCC72_06760 [Dehalococcoidales bacterium]
MAVERLESENLGVLTVGFSPVVRAGLQSILSKDETIKVIGDAPNGEKAIQVILQTRDRGQTVNVVLTERRGMAKQMEFKPRGSSKIHSLRLP